MQTTIFKFLTRTTATAILLAMCTAGTITARAAPATAVKSNSELPLEYIADIAAWREKVENSLTRCRRFMACIPLLELVDGIESQVPQVSHAHRSIRYYIYSW